MRKNRLKTAFIVGTVGLAAASSAPAALLIDGLTGPQSISIGPAGSNPITASGEANFAGAIGGSRLSSFTRTAGSGLVSSTIDSGILNFATGPADAAIASLSYDGNVNGSFDPSIGLGGIDLTQSGANNAITFAYRADLAGATVSVKVYSSTTDYSVGSFIISATGFGAAPFVTGNIPFASMITGGGAGATLSSVRGIVLTIDGSATPSLDLQLQTVASDVVPEPATLGLTLGAAGMMLGRRRRMR